MLFMHPSSLGLLYIGCLSGPLVSYNHESVKHMFMSMDQFAICRCLLLCGNVCRYWRIVAAVWIPSGLPRLTSDAACIEELVCGCCNWAFYFFGVMFFFPGNAHTGILCSVM